MNVREGQPPRLYRSPLEIHRDMAKISARIRENEENPKGGNGRGIPLGVATADGNNGLWVCLSATANDGSVFLVGNGGNGAGIDNIDIAPFRKGRDSMPLLPEELLHSLGLVLIDFAA